LQNEGLGREYKRGMEEGIRQGIEQGEYKGPSRRRIEGVPRHALEEVWAAACLGGGRLLTYSEQEILEMALRLF
jgi:hypothetical protein